VILVRKNPSVHSGRLEQWIGTERIEALSRSTRGWYGRPIPLLDLPGTVKLCGDGDFVGSFGRGYAASAADALWDAFKRAARSPHGQFNAGFTSISDALARASGGFRQQRSIYKTGPTGVAGITSSLWRLGSQPAAGGAPSGAPGGTAFNSATGGAIAFINPAAGTLRLTGADFMTTQAGNSLLLYDRLWGFQKTMNSSANEAVTGVPTRYQNTSNVAEDYIGDNFISPEVGGTALAGTAHNWQNGLYTNQAGTANQALPTFTGVASAIVDRLDSTLPVWFMPLASGDNGIKNLTRIAASALVATGVMWFVIGHPIGFMVFPVVNLMTPFDWLTNRSQAPLIANDACLALYELSKPTTTATNYGGSIYAVSTAS